MQNHLEYKNPKAYFPTRTTKKTTTQMIKTDLKQKTNPKGFQKKKQLKPKNQ